MSVTSDNALMLSHHAIKIHHPSPLDYSIKNLEPLPLAFDYRLSQLAIGNVKEIIHSAYLKPIDKTDFQTILVATEFITEDAQQALLKIIEEPPSTTRFVFVLPIGYKLLPTLESRFNTVVAGEVMAVDSEVFNNFKQASYLERLTLVAKALENKDINWQRNLKAGLVAYLEGFDTGLKEAELIEIEYVVRTLLTRGASNKFLLEHLALNLPT